MIVRKRWLAVLLTVLLPAEAATQDVVARISYTELHDRILPFPEKTATNAQLEVRLASHGMVQHSESRSSGSARGDNSASLKLGSGNKGGWRVAASNKLINITDFKSYQRAILVSVSGQSCNVRVAYNLKPGFTDFRYRRLKNGEDAVARSVSATNQTCSIH